MHSQKNSTTLTAHLAFFQEQLNENPDIVIREFYIPCLQVDAALLFINGMVDEPTIHEQILEPLMTHQQTEKKIDDRMLKNMITVPQLMVTTDREIVTKKILSGRTALLINHQEEILILQTVKYLSRAIDEPKNESTVRGPKESFVESIKQNTVLLRQRIHSPDLTIKSVQIGQRSPKKLNLVYLKKLTDPDLVSEVEKRLKRINIDYLNDIGCLEQLIDDNYLSLFPLTQNTERPDRVCASLMEGRVAILLDGSPSAILLPFTLPMVLQTPDDYYENWWFGSSVRLIRLFALIVTTLFPALYIALISYHPGLIPTKLITSIVSSREGIPFPAFFEALLMEITIELLREAGIRLPKTIGQAVGIVGGLVIGQAAVMAGIVSQIMLIIVSLTAIASFSIPDYSTAISLRILRFLFMIVSSIFGLYGILWLFIIVSIHLVRLESFGTIYTTPISPMVISDWKDALLRLPIHLMKKRPYSTHAMQKQRTGEEES